MLLVGRTDNNQNKTSKYPLSCLSFIAKTPFSRQQKTSGFNSLGLGWCCFPPPPTKQRAPSTGPGSFTLGILILFEKKEKRRASCTGGQWLTPRGEISISRPHRAAATVMDRKGLIAWPVRRPVLIKAWILRLLAYTVLMQLLRSQILPISFLSLRHLW